MESRARASASPSTAASSNRPGDGVLVTDLTNAVVAVNPAFCTHHRLRRRAASRAAPRRVPPSRRSAALRRLPGAGPRPPTWSPRGVLCVCADGAPDAARAVRASASATAGASHVLSVVRDVTERERSLRLLEQKVAERTRELSTLLEISNTVASNLQLKPLLRVVLEQLQIVLGCTGATHLRRRGRRAGDPRSPRAARRRRGRDARLPGRQMIACAQERNGSPLIIDNLWGDGDAARAFRERAPEALTALLMHTRSVLFVPLQGPRSARSASCCSTTTNRIDSARATARWPGRSRTRRRSRSRMRGSTITRASWRRSRSASVSRATCTTPSPRACTRRRCWGARCRGAWESDQKLAREMLGQLGEVTEAALAEMRTLLLELRPAAILQTALEDLLQRLARRCARISRSRSRSRSKDRVSCRARSTSRSIVSPRRRWEMSSATRRPRRRGCGWPSPTPRRR